MALRIYKIPLKVLAKPRPRFGKGRTYLPKNYMDQRKEIQSLLMSQNPDKLKGPLYVSIVFYTKGKRLADVEQLAGALKDAMEDICYYDDIQISDSRTKHRRTGKEDTVIIRIQPDTSSDESHYKEVNYERQR